MATSATTYTFLVQPGQIITCRSGNQYTADANGVLGGVVIGDIRDIDTAGGIALGLGANAGAGWNVESAIATVAAFGATQGQATPVTSERVVVTVTASSEGVKLVYTATGGETAIVVQRGAIITAPVVACLTTPTGKPLPVPQRTETHDKAHAIAAVMGERSVSVQLPMDKLAALVTG